jgi:hypothetical protein
MNLLNCCRDIWRRFGPNGTQALNIDESLFKKIDFLIRERQVGIDTFTELHKQVKSDILTTLIDYTKWKNGGIKFTHEIDFVRSIILT